MTEVTVRAIRDEDIEDIIRIEGLGSMKGRKTAKAAERQSDKG